MTTNNTEVQKSNKKFYQKPVGIAIIIFLILSFFVWLDGGFEEKTTEPTEQIQDDPQMVTMPNGEIKNVDDIIIEEIISPQLTDEEKEKTRISQENEREEQRKKVIEEKFLKSDLETECKKAIRKNYENISVLGFHGESNVRFYGQFEDFETLQKIPGVYWGLVTGYHDGKQYYCELKTSDGENFETVTAKFK